MDAFAWALLIHAAATWFMTGLIWFVQAVHYPLFSQVGERQFAAYEVRHARRTSLLVGPVMAIEASSAAAAWRFAPEGFAAWALLNVLLLAVIWISTAFLQVPRHRRLARGFDGKAHRELVLTNWLRTGIWTVRSLLILPIAAAHGAPRA